MAAFGRSARKDAGKTGDHLLFAGATRSGEIRALYARNPVETPRFEWAGAEGVAALTPSIVVQTDAGIDLLAGKRRKGDAWKLIGATKGARSGRNFAEAWAIDGADTWWARTEGAAKSSFDFADPETGGPVRIVAGAEYLFEVLAAAHRCRAEVILSLADRGGRVLEEQRRMISSAAKGGRTRDGYDRVEIAFRAPEGAERVAISFVKGGGEPDSDSFLFVAEPRLRAGWIPAEPPFDLDASDRDRLRHAARGGALVEMATFAVATSAGGSLRMTVGGSSVTAEVGPAPGDGAPAPEPVVVVSALKAALEHDRRSDSAGRHVVALRGWLEKAEAGAAIPDLGAIKAALDAGVTGRARFDKLEFPSVDEPAATVILEVSEPETAWLSLAGLLFAACAAPFEVVVSAPSAASAKAVGGFTEGVTVIAPAKGRSSQSAAIVAARADRLVFLDAGFEPVSGWLDELLAVFRNFDGVAAAVAKTVETDGRLAAAGHEITAKGALTARGADGNPRDPAFGHVTPVDAGRPLMVGRKAFDEAGGFDAAFSDAGLAQADLAARLTQLGGRALLAPTAEFWRLKGAPKATLPPAGETAIFKARWAPMFAAPAMRARDRGLKVLFVDQEAPTVDMDAGGYAAFQEVRMLQAMGAAVSFLPKNMAWMDRHTLALQRAGVRCHYAPFAESFEGFLRDHANDYDVIFVLRYKVARLVQQALEGLKRRPKLVLNLADLHFLREIREAAAVSPGFTEARARETQAAELAAIAGSDLTLTYSDVEAAVIESHTFGQARIARAPWVVETRDAPIGKPGGASLMFLGGFGHPPNIEAVKDFVANILPRIVERVPEARLTVVGSKAPPDVLALASPHVEIAGYVPDLDEAFAAARVFVAPLIAGAGLKGKVVEAMARGVPMVLSPIAAEGTGLIDGADCLIARTPEDWAQAVERLCKDGRLWRALAEASLASARARFGFAAGVESMRAALAVIDVFGPPEPGLHYRRALPDVHAGAPAAPAVLRRPGA